MIRVHLLFSPLSTIIIIIVVGLLPFAYVVCSHYLVVLASLIWFID